MAETVYYVDTDSSDPSPDGTAAHPYATLNDAEQAKDADITGGNAVVFRCFGTAEDTEAVGIGGWITDADSYVKCYCDSADGDGRHAGVWSASKYRLVVTDANALTIQEDYVAIDGLQIKTVLGASPANGKSGIIISSITATNNWTKISNCVVVGHNHATYTQSLFNSSDADTVLYLWNCILYNTNAITGNFALVATCSSALIAGCTVIGGQYAIRGSGTVTVKNTYAGGASTEDFVRNSGTLTKVNCASEDQSADDDNGSTELATNCVAAAVDCTTANVTFVDPANGDFRLAATSALIGAGATLIDDPPGSTALGVDIAGTTRS